MVDRPKKPSNLTTTTSPIAQELVSVSHSNSRVSATLATGESLDILLFGATIISWKDKNGQELLWLSESANLDGQKAVRGGLPLVFPIFGKDSSHASTSQLPQHGFARISYWDFLGKSSSESDGDDSVKLDFGLSPANLTEENKKNWPYTFGLIYSVTLSKNGLTTSLVVRNGGEKSWDFQALLHTYFRVKDISTVEITGLESSPYLDKASAPNSSGTSSSEPQKINSKIDQIFTPAKSSDTPILIHHDGNKKFQIIRDNFNEVVVWNPWKEDAACLSDFEPKEGYKNMICVEVGVVNGWIELGPGETWEGSQIISVH
ncbi:unnamed protein product [Blumeria hordei]|uniref:Glucose-6-phosphate 1-epimerase n=1 Tax=Blumeria hordei TaxID=2867405 RepID=A0A383UU38_BLUHO|nr:unnamed protein product [Blumeria hordei]